MKNTLLFFIFSLSFLTVFNSCNKKECRIGNPFYQFDIPVTLTPALDTFNIGDTITINSSFSDFIQEINTGTSFILADYSFEPYVQIYLLDSVSTLTESYISNNFEVIISPQYSFNLFVWPDGRTNLAGEYSYQNSTYSLEYKLIAKKPGGYYFSQSAILGSEQLFDGKCENLQTNVYVNMNNRKDNNFHLLKDVQNPYIDKYLKNVNKKFNKYGGYAFYVK